MKKENNAMRPRTRTGKLILLVLGALFLLLVAACAAPPAGEGEEPTGDAAAPGEEASSVVRATGEVIPETYAVLSFPVPGRVAELLVEEGSTVEEGDVLARLDTTDRDASVADAEAALAIAKAKLAETEAGAREEEIQEARDQVAAANARISEASASRDQLYSAVTEEEIISAQANLREAQQNLLTSQEGYDSIMYYYYNWDSIPHIDELQPGEATPLDGEQGARRGLEYAVQNAAAAQAVLDDLLDGPNPESVAAANATIAAAAAQRDASQAYLDLLLAGPMPEEIAVAEAEVAQAEAALEVAQANREQAVLVAPFSGTVTSLAVEISEWVQVGTAVLTLGDLDTLRVETTDLNEIDVALLVEGDTVNVSFDALPGMVQTGTVTHIAPKADEGSGVNYRVIVELDELPEAVRWGMTAFVDIDTEE
jgi:multidrug efflux pump subunit AcrA (membrane-fusion protein)